MRTIPLNFDEPKLNINRGVPLNGFCLLLHASFDSTATVQCRAHVYTVQRHYPPHGEEVG